MPYDNCVWIIYFLPDPEPFSFSIYKPPFLSEAKIQADMDDFKTWLDDYYPTILPKSPLGKALAYCLKHWTGLCEFLTDGKVEVHNNHTEQEIRPFVQARKNFLFYTSVKGANALELHYCLIHTAKTPPPRSLSLLC